MRAAMLFERLRGDMACAAPSLWLTHRASHRSGLYEMRPTGVLEVGPATPNQRDKRTQTRQKPPRKPGEADLRGGELMRRANAQHWRAARKGAAAYRPKSARAQPARVPREAAYKRLGSDRQGQTPRVRPQGSDPGEDRRGSGGLQEEGGVVCGL